MSKVHKIEIESHYEDLELVKKVMEKDEEALEKLYFKYSQRLSCFISCFVTAYEDAQDILQSTFISALSSLDAYQDKSQFFTWLCGIARHKVGDYFRMLRKHGHSSVELVGESRIGSMHRGSEYSPEDWLIDKEFSNQVRTVIGMLPEHYQRLLIEKYIHGKTLKELAADQVLTEKAVESQITRARKLFKRLVKENDYFAGSGLHE